MARLLANWLTVLRNCNVLIHSQVQSPSHFHQLAGVSFPPSLPLLPLRHNLTSVSYSLLPVTPFTFTNILPTHPLLMLSVSPWFFHCVHYSSSPADTAKVEGTFATFAELLQHFDSILMRNCFGNCFFCGVALGFSWLRGI